MHDDELLFADEHPPAAAPETEHPPWNILIVDDDEEVHTVTKLVLSNFSFAGRPLQFYSVYSATEGRDFLLKHDDVAVIFLDVVMEKSTLALNWCMSSAEIFLVLGSSYMPKLRST